MQGAFLKIVTILTVTALKLEVILQQMLLKEGTFSTLL